MVGRPLLRKKVFAVFARPVGNANIHLSRLEETGALFLGGPLATLDGTPEGMFAVVRAASTNDAREIFGLSGAQAARARPWIINEGRFPLDLHYSHCRYTLSDSTDNTALGEELFLLETFPLVPSLPESIISAHLAYQFALEDRGALLAAGPLRTEDDFAFSGSGLVIYRTIDAAGAKALADADPMHRSGARTWYITRLRPSHGALTVTVRRSTGSFTLD